MVMCDWQAKLLGLGEKFLHSSGIGGGVIQVSKMYNDLLSNASDNVLSVQGTASDAAVLAIVAARSSYMRKHPEAKIEDLVIYTTTQTHSIGVKTGLVLGLQFHELPVTAEDAFALRGETLRRALEEDVANGKRPLALSACLMACLYRSRSLIQILQLPL